MGILIVSALAFIVAFKAGLFNMGVSGQMFAGAIAATFVAHKLGLPTGLSQVVMLLVAIGAATIVAVAIGAMKVFLNVNEVVSSIMLN
ncbi:ABC transporter permease [bacterium]|nr:ABC transporter permease [bacterium]